MRPAMDPDLWDTPLSPDLPRTHKPDGYVSVRIVPSVGWESEHRMALAQKLGRPLRPGESAHHVNGVRHDNRPENLELWIGAPRAGVRASCPHCGESL